MGVNKVWFYDIYKIDLTKLPTLDICETIRGYKTFYSFKKYNFKKGYGYLKVNSKVLSVDKIVKSFNTLNVLNYYGKVWNTFNKATIEELKNVYLYDLKRVTYKKGTHLYFNSLALEKDFNKIPLKRINIYPYGVMMKNIYIENDFLENKYTFRYYDIKYFRIKSKVKYSIKCVRKYKTKINRFK